MQSIDEKIITIAEKEKTIDKWIDNLQATILALKDIKEGISESAACRKYNVSKEMLRKLISGYPQKVSSANAQNKNEILFNGSERLWCDIFVLYGVDAYQKMPADVDQTVECVIKKMPISNQQIIRMYYFEHLTTDEIGKKLGISPAIIKTSLSRILYNMRKPRYSSFLFYGKNYYLMQKNKKMDEKIKKAQTLNSEYQGKIAALRQLQQENEKLEDFLSSNGFDVIAFKSVENLGLSLRTYNCLRRNNISTIGDLMKITKKDLSTLRNMGQKGLMEICDTLKKMDIVLQEE